MKRKVIKQGNGTLTITLPKKWSNEVNLKGGDEIFLSQKEGNMIISPSVIDKKKKITIKLNSSYYKYIKAILRNLYIQGYESIKIIYNSKKDYVSISDIIEEIIGFEIINNDDNSCTLESISEIKYEQYAHFLNKQFQIIKEMNKIILNFNDSKTKLDDLAIIDSLNKKSSKYACLCRRVLTKNNLMNNDDAIITFTVITLILMISKSLARIYDYLYKNKEDLTKDDIDYFTKSSNLFNDLYNIFIKKNNDSISITEKRVELLTKELVKKFSQKTTPIFLHHTAEIIRLIGTCAPKIDLVNEFLKDSIKNSI